MLVHSARCYAFEPRRQAAARLLRSLTHRSNPRLRVEAVALSDKAGEAHLRIAVNGPGRSTIESANHMGEAGAIETATVPVRRLDEYADQLGEVGFIKIDVEGHEEAVLRGARAILLKDRPAVLVEIEERHNAGSVQRVMRYLKDIGYRGLYFRGGRLRASETFDAGLHQDLDRLSETSDGEPAYVNNFLFISEVPQIGIRGLIDG
jgi:FkbM family methyltransferase